VGASSRRKLNGLYLIHILVVVALAQAWA
jgi:hypothetical protein